jgi:putative CocE/NonD family hydrolase
LRFPTADFGPEASIPIRATQADWFDRWCNRTRASEEPKLPLLHIFVMGPNIWREEHEWPLARARFTPFYLSSAGHANTREGDGTLARHPVHHTSPDTYTYDPKNPVPTVGGAICCDPRLLPAGPLEQSAVERRTDVLVYNSAPLRDDVEVTGPVKALLYVATSANDTDFTAKLVDVQPGGQALAICDGILRMRYRLSLEKPVFVKRNAVYQISVDAGVTSYVFAAGHRIRLEISSSNFPRFDRNLNSSGPNADVTKSNRAKQTLYHDKIYPSALILPVVPRHG